METRREVLFRSLIWMALTLIPEPVDQLKEVTFIQNSSACGNLS